MTGDKKRIDDIPLEDRLRTFDLMKETVANIKPLYSIPEDPNILLRLEVDASKVGIGGWLYYLNPECEDQESTDVKHVVAMGAHVFSKPAEKEWCTKTKELYAIWRFVKDWERILRGRRFEIVTDHANLTFSSRNSTDVQRRKLRFLSEFDYKLIWKAGEDNVVPDALSRIFGEIASRIEESEGVQIMNDQENAASASVLAQEASDSIAEVRASEELAPIENDSASRWFEVVVKESTRWSRKRHSDLKQ